MGLVEGQDYLFAPKVDINEGISTGTVTKAALVGTKKALYAIPQSAIGVLGTTATSSKYRIGDGDPVVWAQAVVSDPDMTVEDCDKVFYDALMDDKVRRVYPITELSKFSIQVGFWVFGGMRLRPGSEGLRIINIQPKARRASWSEFYADALC